MATRMIRISLSELKTFRIVCKTCGKGVIEVPVEHLHSALGRNNDCVFCQKSMLDRSVSPNPLVQLGRAIEALVRAGDLLEVQVEVPEPQP